MRGQLRLPGVLSVAVLTAVSVGEIVGCGDGGSPDPDARADGRLPDGPPVDGLTPDAVECVNYCFPDGTGTGDECPFPTCATGPDFMTCPDHCSVGI
jgi:hypothetical protein